MLGFIVLDPGTIKRVKLELEREDRLNKKRKIECKDGTYIIYSTFEQVPSNFSHLDTICYDDETINQIDAPKKYSVYPPMVLVSHPLSEGQANLRWLPKGITHVALNKPIADKENEMRLPSQITPIIGDFGPHATFQRRMEPSLHDFDHAFWCTVVQNDIWQTWAPRYTMFSRGNVKEKARLLHFKDIKNSVVLDLYCGIGYFSLLYLRLGARVLGWDINPWSIEAFRRALEHQNIKYKVIRRGENFDNDWLKSDTRAFLFLELNEYALERLSTTTAIPLSHINLGLLPTSKPSWPIVTKLLPKSTHQKTTVHVHENVHIKAIDTFSVTIQQSLGGTISSTNRVKTFAPDVWHVVYDVEIHREH